jgi:anti-sigma B factor antagonist
MFVNTFYNSERKIEMLITKTTQGNSVVLSLTGNMDNLHSVQLSDELDGIISAGIYNTINIDLKQLDYISSSGLRVLLAAHKRGNAIGTKIELYHANDTVKEVLRVTGFSEIIKVH